MFAGWDGNVAPEPEGRAQAPCGADGPPQIPLRDHACMTMQKRVLYSRRHKHCGHLRIAFVRRPSHSFDGILLTYQRVFVFFRTFIILLFSSIKRASLQLINRRVCWASMSSLTDIYRLPESRQYPEYLRSLYGVNRKLRKDGILAPGDASVHNVRALYKALGRPLDKIPTIHVGGTNGKVNYNSDGPRHTSHHLFYRVAYHSNWPMH